MIIHITIRNCYFPCDYLHKYMNCSLLLHLMNWHDGERERKKEGGKDTDSYLTQKSIWKEGGS